MPVTNAPSLTEQYAAGREGSRETADRLPGDTFLRNHGFSIHARPDGAPAVWRRTRDDRLFPEDEARGLAVRDRDKALRDLRAKGK